MLEHERQCSDWLARQSVSARNVARARYAAIAEVEAMECMGWTATAAIAIVAAQRCVSPSAIWRWRACINGCGQSTVVRLRHLCPDFARRAR